MSFRDLTSLSVALVTPLMDCSHPVWAHSLEHVSLGESQMCVFIGGACLSRTLGASLLLCNVVNRAMSDVQVNPLTPGKGQI